MVLGRIYDQITFENNGGSWYDVTLLVVDDKTMSYDLLLGREFFDESKLTYYQGNYHFENGKTKSKNIYDIFSINITEERKEFDELENLDDLSWQERKGLLQVFESVEKRNIKPVTEEYYARVNLKDYSIFRYAPRRMPVSEKKELDEIVDDSLERKIIKHSVSSYCARVVLVPKRNGKKNVR